MKEYIDYDGNKKFAYTNKDLDTFASIIKKATDLWKEECKAHFAKHGDSGSCVLGAGITVDYIPPRCRKPRREIIIASSTVAQCQGSINWEDSKDIIMGYLKENGIDCGYNYGRMD